MWCEITARFHSFAHSYSVFPTPRVQDRGRRGCKFPEEPVSSRRGGSEPSVHLSDQPGNLGRLGKSASLTPSCSRPWTQHRGDVSDASFCRGGGDASIRVAFSAGSQERGSGALRWKPSHCPSPLGFCPPARQQLAPCAGNGVQVHGTYLRQRRQSTEKRRAFSAPDTKEFKLRPEPLQCQVHGGHQHLGC